MTVQEKYSDLTRRETKNIKYQIEKIKHASELLFNQKYYLTAFFINDHVAFKIIDSDNDEIMGYCEVGYSKNDENNLQVECLWVESTFKSNLAPYAGSFLFNLQLILASLCDVKHFELDNHSDNPIRASEGIYKHLTFTHSPSLAEMHIDDFSDFNSKWKDDMQDMAKQIAKKDSSLWQDEIEKKMDTYIELIISTGKGKKKRKKRRKSKRRKTRQKRKRRQILNAKRSKRR